ncbi:hypothetical protein N2152v2_002609 [Parachlorella kessleri]
MILRLRSRDGLERVEVPDTATVADLRRAIHEKLNIPLDDIVLSKDASLLTTKDVSRYNDLAAHSRALKQLGVQHGDLVYLLYHIQRDVQPAVKRTEFDSRPFGRHMTVEEMVALQTRIERQDAPHCASVSFDSHAANVFQSYISSAIGFSIKRGGILYGTVDDEKRVCVQAIFEPPQEGSADSLQLERHTAEEQKADFIAERLGWKKVGWIFAQSTKERDYIMNTEEICQMAAMQDEIGETCVTAVVAVDTSEEGHPEVHFEAFQVSDQCVKLNREGWFQPQAEPSGVSMMSNPKDPSDKAPVIVAGKDVAEVDNDYFLLPVSILDHEGPLMAAFPVENRLLPQGKPELKQHLQKFSARPYSERLADFHLLLYLSRQPNFDLSDIGFIVDAVKSKAPLQEGYKIIIDSLAGL